MHPKEVLDKKLFCHVTHQIWKVMKLVMFLLTVLALQVSAKSFSQTITFHSKENISVEKALNIITEQTGYSFIGEKDVLNNAPTIALSLKKATLTDALNQCLKGLPLTYDIEGKIVVLVRKAVPNKRIIAQVNKGVAEEPDTIIHGRVTDNAGKPLVGVTIQVKGTTTGTTTDGSGKFSLSVQNNAVLLISSLGYRQKEEPVNGRKVVNISLAPTTTGLNQLVVIGYGEQKKSDLTGAISSLSSKDFNQGIVSSPDQLFAGKAAGVQVVQNNAEPGGGVSISIRGASSINAGSGPLFVIDGLPIDNNQIITGTGSTEYVPPRSPSNPLSTINPADIKSIEILKDASATAIYGARGANGVIIITTKHGSQGKLKVNYNAYIGVQNVVHKIKLLNPEQYKNILNNLITAGAAPVSNEVTDIEGGGTDWQSAIFAKNAPVQNHNISFSGGNPHADYYVSLNYFNQNGVVKTSSFKRYSTRANLTLHPSNQFKMGLNFSTSYSINDLVPIGFGINGEAGTIYSALNFDPTLSIKDSLGNYTVSPLLDMDNPLAEIYGKTGLVNTYRTMGTIYGVYTILPGLSAKLNLGGSILNERRDTYVGRLTRHGAPQGGIGAILQGMESNYLVEGTLTYDKTFGVQHLNIVGGITTQRFITQNTNMGASEFPSDATLTYNMGLGNQTTYELGSNKASNKLLSYLGRINYSIKDKYLLTGSFRVDGSSRFGINNRFGYFPSFAAAWRINEENFMRQWTAISNLKLRASWGQTGNQEIGDYAALTTFTSGGTAILDEQPVSSTVPARLPNPNLKWETTSQADIGVDFGFFNERISGSIDYYNKRTFNMLLALPVPTSTGFNSKLSNAGSLRNVGWEFSLNSMNLNGRFQWNTSIDLSTIKNKVLNLGGIPQIITGGAGQVDQPFVIQPGLPIYTFYGYKVIGIWQKNDDYSKTKDDVHPGDLKFEDVNGDGTVNASDRVPLGSSFPKLTWSLGNTFSYKNFELDIFIEGTGGAKMLNVNLVDAYFPVSFRRNRFATPYLNRWTPDHPSNKYPSFVTPTDQGDKLVNSYTVENASYARLKTLTLSYNLNTGSKFIQNVKLYISGENLYILTKYDGYDPSVNPNGNVFRRIDFNAYPTARTYLFGVSVNF